MTSEDLAKEVMAAVVAVQSRILGVGKEQYDQGSEQKFERMSFRELIQYAREEVEDGIAYNVMLRYKLGLMEKALNAAFTGYEQDAGRHSKPEQVLVDPPVANAPADYFAPTDWTSIRDAARGLR
ncbi:hypothetical protein [Nonomuraea sp. NPDC049129]|uniref:hypothetical protein n=1 Tax=Nonomuraea sp. NPDC049129 TaxID=3155272 RepID=UPI0033FFC661